MPSNKTQRQLEAVRRKKEAEEEDQSDQERNEEEMKADERRKETEEAKETKKHEVEEGYEEHQRGGGTLEAVIKEHSQYVNRRSGQGHQRSSE